MKGFRVDGLIDNNEKVASCKKNSRLECNNHTPTKTAEKPYPLGRTYLYSPYKGSFPYKGVHPGGGGQNQSTFLITFDGNLKTTLFGKSKFSNWWW